MEGLEFYDHGARFHYGDSLKNIVSRVHTSTGSATVSQEESNLIYTIHLVDGVTETLKFNIKGDNYPEMEYINFEAIVFFSSNEEYIIFQRSQILVHKSWPAKVASVKLNQELSLAVFYEDGGIITCTLDPVNGDLVNIFQGNPDVQPENMPVTWGSRSKNYKRSVKERASSYVAKGGPLILWAADGEHFVVNTLKNGNRILMVFSNTCQLLYKSEPEMFPGLELPIAIEPENALIACALSETGSDQELVILEKNLEILYSLQLDDCGKVQKMQWSNCSEVLAVWQKSENKSWLDLYMKSSTKFYLKQRLPFSKVEELLDFQFTFSMENSYIIQLIFKNYLFQYSFLKKLIKSDNVKVGANLSCKINGRSLDMYFFGNDVSPQSFSQPYNIISDDYISTVVFDSFRPRFAIIDIAYKVVIYKYTKTDFSVITKFSLDNNDIVVPLTYYKYFFDPNGNFCAVRMGNSNSNFSSDTVYHYAEPDYTLLKKENCNMKILKGQRIINFTNSGEDNDEKLRLIHAHNEFITDYIVFKFNYEYSFTRYCIGSIDVNNTGLSGLFTSIHFTDTHILLTCHREDLDSANDYLLVMELNEPTIQKLDIGIVSIFDVTYSRPIEKGAVILNNISKTSMIILLLPRGNTELIHIRNISLKMLNQVLMAKDFEGAYNLIKFESLGLNLLVDLDPLFFKKNLQEIVQYLYEVSALHRFLVELTDFSSLSSEDKKCFNAHSMKNKRSEVCNMVINLILDFEEPVNYLSEIALAGLCCQSEGFNSIKAAEVICVVTGPEFNKFKTEIIIAIKNLNSYVTYDIQYKAALEVNNLDLAELVAERSEMDPQEYRPFLTKLKTLSDINCRQTIATFLGNTSDIVMYYLQRYEEGEVSYNDLLQFAEKNKCFDLCYQEIIRTGLVPYEIAEMYALQLEKEGNFKEAAIVASGNNMHQQAYLLFMKGLCWEEAISSLYRNTNISQDERKQCFFNIAKCLEFENKLKEAATVYYNFCEDQQSAVNAYMKGLYFKEAYHILLKHNKTELIKQVLIPNVQESMRDKFHTLKEIQIRYTTLFDRLIKVRESKTNFELEEEKSQDYFSDAGSVRTKSTRSISSKTTTKRKAKEERKATNIREGSKYEDIAIMRHLHFVVEEAYRIMNTLEEQASILDLLTISKDHVHNNMILGNVKDFKKQMLDTCDEIWPELLRRFECKFPQEAAFVNISGLDLKYRCKPIVLSKLNIKE